jgi:hypothetical protein
MLKRARWLIPSESAEVLSTDSRVTCSIEPIRAAALIAIRCRTPWIPVDPIAMNTVRIPSKASVRSRGDDQGLHVAGGEFHRVRDLLLQAVLAADAQHGHGQAPGRALLVLRDGGI